MILFYLPSDKISLPLSFENTGNQSIAQPAAMKPYKPVARKKMLLFFKYFFEIRCQRSYTHETIITWLPKQDLFS